MGLGNAPEPESEPDFLFQTDMDPVPETPSQATDAGDGKQRLAVVLPDLPDGPPDGPQQETQALKTGESAQDAAEPEAAESGPAVQDAEAGHP